MGIIEESLKTHSIVLFDGVCNLCNSSVKLIIKYDNKEEFLFDSLQSDNTQEFLNKASEKVQKLDSIILVTSKKIYTKSSAALQIAKQLNGLYPLLFVFYIIPKPIRDIVYDFIAKNRYKWFGKKDNCMIPTPAMKSKFL